MKAVKVIVARVYITEASNLLKPILHYLKNEANIRGMSVFRAISGFGDTGTLHTASLVDLSLNLPIVIEFFDDVDKVKPILKHLNTILKPEHIIFWEAGANER
jgi:PII-like signaling protein